MSPVHSLQVNFHATDHPKILVNLLRKYLTLQILFMSCIHNEMLTAVIKRAYSTRGKQAERLNAVCFAPKRELRQ
jgi:hypothetical protein